MGWVQRIGVRCNDRYHTRTTWRLTYAVGQHEPRTNIIQKVFELDMRAKRRQQGKTMSGEE